MAPGRGYWSVARRAMANGAWAGPAGTSRGRSGPKAPGPGLVDLRTEARASGAGPACWSVARTARANDSGAGPAGPSRGGQGQRRRSRTCWSVTWTPRANGAGAEPAGQSRGRPGPTALGPSLLVRHADGQGQRRRNRTCMLVRSADGQV